MHITFYDVIHIFDIHLMGWKYQISNKHNEYPHVHRILGVYKMKTPFLGRLPRTLHYGSYIT